MLMTVLPKIIQVQKYILVRLETLILYSVVVSSTYHILIV